MEKKIGTNRSSGAKKVENIEAKQKAENVDPAPNPSPEEPPVNSKKRTPVSKKTPVKSKKPSSVKKDPKPSEKKNSAHEKAVKREKAAAKKRAVAAKEKANRKREKRERKASLKEKKLEKRARLQEKKLARKNQIEARKEERKQKQLEKQAAVKEKKAAVKEKRAERRAERVARREMLKHETATKKHQRLAREKRERTALKRKKAEGKDRARARKIKSREAAHARKAEERKHRREQRTARKDQRRGFGGWLAAVISLGVACLALSTIVTAGALRMNDMRLASETGYRASLYEMVSVAGDMENDLNKLRVSSGVDEQRKLLTDLLVESELMESALQKIPLSEETGADLSSFVNRTGAFARTMLARLAAGKTLTENQKETIAQMYEVNASLANELNTLATTVTEKDFRTFLAGKEGTVREKFGSMGEGTKQEIFEAPFSKEGNVGENALMKEEEIPSSRAEELVKQYFSAYHISSAVAAGETATPDFTAYNFVLTDENGTEYFAEITKNGGKLAFFETYEPCTQKNFDLPSCDAVAREYLKTLGIENAEAVWLSDGGMVADLTYVSVQDGVRVYPEMIRVRVCEEKGRVIGLDARGYLLNRKERSLTPALDREEVKSLLNENLTFKACDLALVPIDGEEVLCYEFDCTFGEEEYLVYLDAETGAERELFRVRQSARGSYLD